MQHQPKRPMRRLLTLLFVAGLVIGSCGDDDDNGQVQPPEQTTEPTASPEPTPTSIPEPTPRPEPTASPEPTRRPEPTLTPEPAAPAPDGVVVNVYWLRDTQLAVGGRVLPDGPLAVPALEALLAGPNQLEAELDMATAVADGTEVLGLTVEDRVATVDLSEEFERPGLGTTGEIGLVAQIVFTLTQFADIDEVDITIEGEPRDVILSHGLEATGLTREGLHDAVAPAIVVESPYPGQVVASPLTVRGFSRTFEAMVVYAVTVPPNGEIVDDGVTTAAQPAAALFGPFEFSTEFASTVEGSGAVIVFEESAEDGSQINVYEVPVLMAPTG